ncbi:hypothetical protein [Massilia aquatica]|uniref:hypothetical protein n=1 Tax=Massilia aquatica TaxID=2609000 RepID=UPI001E46D11E|nr:hypothetical protein [Massilia aquatica]
MPTASGEPLAQAGRLQVIEHGVAMIDGLAVDARGRLFISDQRENSVHAIDSAGKRTQFAGQRMVGGYPDPYSATSILSPSRLGTGDDGSLYIADRGQVSGGCINFSRIRQIAPDGKVSAIAHADAAMDRASFPPEVTTLAVGRNGDLYVQEPPAPAVKPATYFRCSSITRRLLWPGGVSAPVRGAAGPSSQVPQLLHPLPQPPDALFWPNSLLRKLFGRYFEAAYHAATATISPTIT